jgi:hypothetical protein
MTRRNFAVLILICILNLAAVIAGPVRAEQNADAHVYVILWFDTEDYLLPADDDATLRISEFLTKEGIRCTHKLVGEKVRVLEKRGRTDVIDAIKKHEVGYHSDFHSVQPTPALFMSTQGWDDGVAEFDRRERQGMLDVERITGQKPSCYGQPGSSWGPQQFGAMRQWGMPIYLDAGSHVKLDGDPFWYCGILNLYALKATLRTSLGGPQDLDEARKRFDKAYEELLAEGGGPVSIYYHPCEFVHKQFWDGVNFSKGANPPRSEWKVPPQKTPEESRVAYETFEGYIRFIKEHPKVKFITAREALELYRDRAIGREFSRKEIDAIAQRVLSPTDFNTILKLRELSPPELETAKRALVADDAVSFQRGGNYSLSAAEVFQLLVAASAEPASPRVKLARSPIGPTQLPPAQDVVECDRSQMERTIADVADYMKRHHRVPNAVWLGSMPVSPESFLKTLATYSTTDETKKTFRFEPNALDAARFVADDNPKLWGWVIFPPGFKAPEMMQLAKRQAWTLKPAVLSTRAGGAAN